MCFHLLVIQWSRNGGGGGGGGDIFQLVPPPNVEDSIYYCEMDFSINIPVHVFCIQLISSTCTCCNCGGHIFMTYYY